MTKWREYKQNNIPVMIKMVGGGVNERDKKELYCYFTVIITLYCCCKWWAWHDQPNKTKIVTCRRVRDSVREKARVCLTGSKFSKTMKFPFRTDDITGKLTTG